jgi:hypothetical protein
MNCFAPNCARTIWGWIYIKCGFTSKNEAGVELKIVSAEGFTSMGCGCNCGCTLLHTGNVSSIYE